MESCAAVILATASSTSAMRTTASMLMPARVEATLTDEHTRCVLLTACGMASMSAASPREKPFWTRALKPPTKSMPISSAAASSACATSR